MTQSITKDKTTSKTTARIGHSIIGHASLNFSRFKSLVADRLTKPSAKPIVSSRLIIGVFLMICIAIGVSYYRTTVQVKALRQTADELSEQIRLERELGENLIRKRAFMNTDAYLEREARIEYGLALPGAIRFTANTQVTHDTVYGETVATFSNYAPYEVLYDENGELIDDSAAFEASWR